MVDNDIAIQKIRAAIGDRGLYLALIYRSYLKVLPKNEVERLAREAIHEYGLLKGKADRQVMTPKKWISLYMECGGADLFVGRGIVKDTQCEQIMTYCPLMVAWIEMGCSNDEMDLLCDIAMEVDRGRADYHKIPHEIKERLAKGDSFCRLILKEKAIYHEQ